MKYGYVLPTRASVVASEDSASLAARTQADVIGLAERAEALGLDAVWAGDSVLARSRHEPMTTLSAIGAVTDAVDLGTAVYLAGLRHPVNVAHLAATVDQMSVGRLVIGVGAASANPAIEAEHANLDVSFERRGARLNELLAVVDRLWEGERVDYDGEFYRVSDAALAVPPVRKPPIYVATGGYHPEKGFPRTVRERFVSHGDGYLPNVMSLETYTASLADIYDLLDDAGRDRSSFDAVYYMDVVFGGDESSAIAEARSFYDEYYADRPSFSDAEIRRRGAFGPPSVVAETVDAYADAGVEEIVVRFPTRDQRTNLRALAELA